MSSGWQGGGRWRRRPRRASRDPERLSSGACGKSRGGTCGTGGVACRVLRGRGSWGMRPGSRWFRRLECHQVCRDDWLRCLGKNAHCSHRRQNPDVRNWSAPCMAFCSKSKELLRTEYDDRACATVPSCWKMAIRNLVTHQNSSNHVST